MKFLIDFNIFGWFMELAKAQCFFWNAAASRMESTVSVNDVFANIHISGFLIHWAYMSCVCVCVDDGIADLN